MFIRFPTGFGKSVYYQVLPFMFDHKLGRSTINRSIVLVVSPLVSLMADQVNSLRAIGVGAAIMGLGQAGGQLARELLVAERRRRREAQPFIWYSGSNCWVREVASVIVGRFTMSTNSSSGCGRGSLCLQMVHLFLLHCVFLHYIVHAYMLYYRSPKFRPSFGRLHELRALVPPGTPMLALTATVTPEIRDDVITRLDMKGCVCLYHPYIFYAVSPRTEIETNLLSLVEDLKQFCESKPCHSLLSYT